jgi:branched-chain amino acid transport system substrate-binding protein
MTAWSRRASAAAITAASTITLSLAACGSSQSGGSAADPGVNTSAKTITVGITGPKTGPLASLGESLTAEQALVNKVNATGGVNGWKIKFISLDDQWQAATGVADYKQLIDSDHVFALVGGAGPGLTAALPFMEQDAVPVIGANLLTSTIHVNFPKTKTLTSYTPLEAALSAFNTSYAVQKLGAKSVSFVGESGDVDLNYAPGVELGAKNGGIKVGASLPIPASATDLSSYAAQLKNANADAVVAFLPPDELPSLVKATSAIGYNPKWVAAFYDNNPAEYQLYGAQLANVYFLSLFDAVTSNTPGVTAMMSTLRKYSTDHSPTAQATFGYIGMSLFLDALQEATAGGKTPTRSSILNVIHSGHVFNPGNLGLRVEYPKGGTATPVGQQASIDNVQNGKSVTVFGPAALPTVPQQYIKASRL